MIINDGIELTYTLEDLITIGKTKEITYHNLTMYEKDNNGTLPYYNLVNDYIKDILALARTVKFSADEQAKYYYKPKLLAFDIYGSTDLFFILLLINNMTSAKEFNSEKIKMLKTDDMIDVINAIYNANKDAVKINRAEKGM